MRSVVVLNCYNVAISLIKRIRANLTMHNLCGDIIKYRVINKWIPKLREERENKKYKQLSFLERKIE